MGDNDVSAHPSVVDWRLTTLETVTADQERRLHSVELRMAGMDEKLSAVVISTSNIEKQTARTDDNRLNQLIGFILTIIAVIAAAVLQHIWK